MKTIKVEFTRKQAVALLRAAAHVYEPTKPLTNGAYRIMEALQTKREVKRG